MFPRRQWTVRRAWASLNLHGCLFSLQACAWRGASPEGRQAMKRLIFALLVAVALVLLLASNAR